jgi:hypothetical protein
MKSAVVRPARAKASPSPIGRLPGETPGQAAESAPGKEGPAALSQAERTTSSAERPQPRMASGRSSSPPASRRRETSGRGLRPQAAAAVGGDMNDLVTPPPVFPEIILCGFPAEINMAEVAGEKPADGPDFPSNGGEESSARPARARNGAGRIPGAPRARSRRPPLPV